jgi:putative DNA primase/helicase
MSSSIFDAIDAAGLTPHKPFDLPFDGKVHRFRVTGDKSGKLNGWAVLHDGQPPFGFFGTWKSDEKHAWRGEPTRPLTNAERAATAQRVKATRLAHALVQAEVHEEARTRAAKLWRTARPATNSHPYLVRKRIPAIGIRRLRDMLVVPARDVRGTLHTLQFISADGSKRFLSSGRIAGCYFSMGTPIDRLLIAEGLATGSTLYEATGLPVAVCFSCGNMLAVAQALRDKFPCMRLILCADNDLATPGNPGLTKARQAAQAVGGYLAVPHLRRVATA